MSRLKQKLTKLLDNDFAPQRITNRSGNFSEIADLRQKINSTVNMPIAQFCKTRAMFDHHHGLVYKVLRTDPKRLRDSTLASHDAFFWLHNYKQPVSALWVVKLAGPQAGAVARNRLLHWLKQNNLHDDVKTVHTYTKKWGFKDTDYTVSIITQPSSVANARKQYRDTKSSSTKARQVLGNALLGRVATTGDAEEVWAFFKSLNKDVVSFQTMLGAMVNNTSLRKYREDLWSLAKRQHEAKNIVIDQKLIDTHDRIARLPMPATQEKTSEKILEKKITEESH